MSVDVDDTSNCPLGDECASCGTRDDLAVSTLGIPMGVLCMTLCGDCAEAGRRPKMYLVPGAEKVLEHCGHLGIDADEMAAALDREG